MIQTIRHNQELKPKINTSKRELIKIKKISELIRLKGGFQ